MIVGKKKQKLFILILCVIERPLQNGCNIVDYVIIYEDIGFAIYKNKKDS